MIQELRKEYETQDNRMTAFPIFVTVQELVCVGVMEDGYSVNCPYGDEEMKTKYKHPEHVETFDSEKELIDYITQCDIDSEISEIYSINTGWIWVDREWFLTIKGAEQYLCLNKHNHGKTRTYVHHMERRNVEMRGLLEELNFKVKY